MKVAVPSRGPSPESQVDPRFGRASFFVVVDTDSGRFTTYENSQNAGAVLDAAVLAAGFQAAHDVARMAVSAVITDSIGPRAFAVLEANGIRVHTGATGSVKDAVEQYKSGHLQCLIRPNVRGHCI